MSILTSIRKPTRKIQFTAIVFDSSRLAPVDVFGTGILPQTRAERLAESSRRLAARQVEIEAEAEARGIGQRELDEAWKLGNDLGRAGIEAFAPESMTFVERVAFRLGREQGESEYEIGLALAAEEAWGGVEDGEYAEARMSPPSVPYCLA